MKQTISLVLVAALTLSSYPLLKTSAAYADASSFQFTQDLRSGMTVDPDVKYLQQILDSNAATAVALSGPGSVNQLTTFFGAKTKAAVIAFQNLYRADILTPAGLTSGTGTVGPNTRAKLNQLVAGGALGGSNAPTTYVSYSSQNAISTPQPATGNGAAGLSYVPTVSAGQTGMTTALSGYLTISGFSAYRVIPGQVMSIFGGGFDSTENTVYVGTTNAGTYSADSSGGSITLTVPSGLPAANYQLGVSNKYGTSTSGAMLLEVDSSPAAGSSGTGTIPTLASVSPTAPSYSGDVITITGTNFLPANLIITTLGNINASSTDGKTVSFTPASIEGYSQLASKYAGQVMTLDMAVSNANGLSIERLSHSVIFAASGNVSLNAYNGTGAAASSAGQGSSSGSTGQNLGQQNSSSGGSNTGLLVAGGIVVAGLGAAALLGGGGSASTASSASGASGSDGAASGPTFFGGMIEYVQVCTCGAGAQLLYINDYATKSILEMLYQPGFSTLRQYGNLTEQTYAIGGDVAGSYACWMYEGESCSSGGTAEGMIDTLRGIGTGK